MTEQNDAIAILGGTGDQGLGLAFRFTKAGRTVIIGSRKAERAVTAAEEVAATVPGASVSGCGNEEATAQAGVVIISVPFEHTAGTVKGIKTSLREGQILVSMAVPLATAVGDGALRTLGIWQGSCAEMVASLVPDGVEVVSAFQNVS
ncbi:MAG: NAD(P)-binding domain-containing protein, partial [bacterium]